MSKEKKPDVMPVKAICTLLRVATAQGYDIEPLLIECGLNFNPLNVNDKTPHVIETLAYSTLYKRIMQLLQDESFGFGQKQKSPPGTFRMMCLFIIHCKNLKQALVRSAEFFDYIDQFQAESSAKRLPVTFENQGKTAICRFDGLPPLQMQHSKSFDANIIYMMHKLYSWLIDDPIDLIEVKLRGGKPLTADSYHNLFDCKVSFNAEVSALKFSSSYLNEPIRQNEDSLKTFLKHAPYQLISAKNTISGSICERVHTLLVQGFNGETITIERISEQLNMSSRTLHRKLQKEGQSFQKIKDDARKETAINYLRRSELTISAIALLMGFQDTSAFYRAFKKWTGKAPSFYRQ